MSEAEKQRDSIVPKKKMKASAQSELLRQHKTITSDIRQVVTSITVITAKPAYMLEREEKIQNLLNSWGISTSTFHL